MSLGMMVTRLAWMAHRLVSSNRPTRYASAASWRANTAWLWKRRSVLKSWAISRTSLWKGSFLMSSSVLFWYLRISRSATVPGRYLWGFFTPPVVGADLRAAYIYIYIYIQSSYMQHKNRRSQIEEEYKWRYLGSQLLPGGLASSTLSGSLFGTGHLQKLESSISHHPNYLGTIPKPLLS
ncbi:hypothetical protein RND81_13G218600 [Saponaria officinalis]|uniref:Uncharacterized protein n=1 Tax=Saponaria officinalis TaxID=3572 RepID=A0AAW1H5W1_SAPOF